MALFKMLNGVSVAMSAQEEADFEAARTPSHAMRRIARKNQVVALYEQKIAAGFAYTLNAATKTFQISEQSEGRINRIATRIINGWLPENDQDWKGWRATDNTWMAMTGAEFLVFADAVAARIMALRAPMWLHIDNLTVPSASGYVPNGQIDSYDITTGWPA